MGSKIIRQMQFATAVTILASGFFALMPVVSATKSDQVTICHATNSQTNPYVVETVNTSSVDERNNRYLDGHGNHDGPIWTQDVTMKAWGDIIPAFESPKGLAFPGKNWDQAGKAIYNNGCKAAASVTSVAQSTTPLNRSETASHNSNTSNSSHVGGEHDTTKVTLCHATNSQTNPYVAITVSTSAVDERNNANYNGHGDHDGGIWSKNASAHSWGDIIPQFTLADGTVYPGKNWTEMGRAILAADCQVARGVSISTTDSTPSTTDNKSQVSITDSTKGSVISDTKGNENLPGQLPTTGVAIMISAIMTSLVGATAYGVVRFIQR